MPHVLFGWMFGGRQTLQGLSETIINLNIYVD